MASLESPAASSTGRSDSTGGNRRGLELFCLALKTVVL